MRMPGDLFHAHLDLCQQCREHPFDLCVIGANLLYAEATETETAVSRAFARAFERRQRNRA